MDGPSPSRDPSVSKRLCATRAPPRGRTALTLACLSSVIVDNFPAASGVRGFSWRLSCMAASYRSILLTVSDGFLLYSLVYDVRDQRLVNHTDL